MSVLKNVVLCLAFVGCALAGCSQETLDTNPESLLGRWRMVKVIQDDSTIVKPEPYEGFYEVEIEFMSDGIIKGTSSANSFVGKYETDTNAAISIYCSYTSKVGENVWGNYFVDAIEREGVSTYEISSNLLYLNYSKNQLIFRRME